MRPGGEESDELFEDQIPLASGQGGAIGTGQRTDIPE
jgi:hypothetical protein